MDNVQFTAMVRAVTELTYVQRKYLARLLNTKLSITEIDSCIEEQSKVKTECPHYDCHKIIHWGGPGGLQRYRCKECGKTFNALTNSPLAKLRNRPKPQPFVL